MPADENLLNKVREAIAHLKKVEEKNMFGGTCFMINGKMCICISKDRLMCRIGPDEYETALEKNGCSPMVLKGKSFRGFVFVSEEGFKSKKDFNYWIDLSLAYNKIAKATKKK